MIEALLGSASSEKVLMFLFARDQGYAREIARFFDTDVAPIQKQLDKLENGGILVSRLAGRTRLFSFNPRYPMVAELRKLLEKTLQFYPNDTREALLMVRRRPRRRGKPS